MTVVHGNGNAENELNEECSKILQVQNLENKMQRKFYVLQLIFYIRNILRAAAGCRDGAAERRDGGYGLGREHPLLVDRLEHRRAESRQGRPGLAAAAQQGLLPPRIHVHHLLRLHHLRTVTRGGVSLVSRWQLYILCDGGTVELKIKTSNNKRPGLEY